MSRLIKLTRSSEGTTMHLNVDSIVLFVRAKKKEFTKIYLVHSEDYFSVTETPEKIEELIKASKKI